MLMLHPREQSRIIKYGFIFFKLNVDQYYGAQNYDIKKCDELLEKCDERRLFLFPLEKHSGRHVG